MFKKHAHFQTSQIKALQIFHHFLQIGLKNQEAERNLACFRNFRVRFFYIQKKLKEVSNIKHAKIELFLKAWDRIIMKLLKAVTESKDKVIDKFVKEAS